MKKLYKLIKTHSLKSQYVFVRYDNIEERLKQGSMTVIGCTKSLKVVLWFKFKNYMLNDILSATYKIS